MLPLAQNPRFIYWKWPKLSSKISPFKQAATRYSSLQTHLSAASNPPIRYAVLGAGFAGLSVAWHLLHNGSKEMNICVDIYDEVGVGGGASGIAGGLLHPYSPKVKLLWRGAECWEESLKLINIAEGAFAKQRNKDGLRDGESTIVRRSGILRPAINLKHMDTMIENAQKCLANCRIESINEEAAQNLLPNLSLPLNLAFYMPEALNVNAERYLQGLYLACENLVNEMSNFGCVRRELNFPKKSVQSLIELEGEYDAVIICLGARAVFLPELIGKLPLRTSRGVIAQLQLSEHSRDEYPKHSPAILSDAWIAVQGSRRLDLGSTWDWNSKNDSREVTIAEASKATEELLQKACLVYPAIKHWTVTGSVAGLRAMPPVTADGALPLLGCVDEYVNRNNRACKYWLFTGLGARGLYFHGWLGKLMALAVLSSDEDLIPSELTSWKHKTLR